MAPRGFASGQGHERRRGCRTAWSRAFLRARASAMLMLFEPYGPGGPGGLRGQRLCTAEIAAAGSPFLVILGPSRIARLGKVDPGSDHGLLDLKCGGVTFKVCRKPAEEQGNFSAAFR